MPKIDVSELINDPDFCTSLQIIRRAQSVGTNGRASITQTTLDIHGVVTAGSSDEVQRTPSFGASSRIITVHTITRLYDTTNGELPDIVKWKNTQYLVDRVKDYSEFGTGFYSAECTVIDPVQGA